MHLLFVNCCIRGEESRTLRLCRVALEELKKKYQDLTVEELCLDEEDLRPLNNARLAARHALEKERAFSDPMFRYARQFAAADMVLMGAPYWEFQFPAMLRCYLEHISVGDLTFHYTEEGYPVGLGKVQRLLYVTTAGGPIQGRNCGYDYVKTHCGDMLGVPQMDFAAAENLDVWGADVEGILTQAEQALRQQIRGWQD